MSGLIDSVNHLIGMVQEHQQLMLHTLSFIWIVNLVNWLLLGSRLNVLGIYPRSIPGLLGIVFSPILHGHFAHLFFNSIPLYVLMNFVLLKGYNMFYCVTTIIAVLGGLAVWVVGRRAIHVGASGVITGYFGYLLLQAFTQHTAVNIVLIFVSLYYFGGIISELIPTEADTSWEGHVFGLLAGFAAVYLAPMFYFWFPNSYMFAK